MHSLKNSFSVIVLLFAQVFAANGGGDAPKSQPDLAIVSSEFVNITSSSLTVAGETVSFNGSFLVAGRAVFGHFDMVALNDSGKVVNVTKSEDQAQIRDHGPKPKSIVLSTSSIRGVSKVEVSFHETRINPEVGACVSK